MFHECNRQGTPRIAAAYNLGRGSPFTTTTTGLDAFNQWYNDAPGVNKTTTAVLQLTEDTMNPGHWSFDSSAFYPLDVYGDVNDQKVWGFQGNAHNYHFTMELHTRFTYDGGEQFSFSGDDDVFLFVNGVLAVDIGGVHGEQSDSLDLDAMANTLGITTGNDYDFDFFFAERHTVESNFHVDTTISCLQQQ